MDFLPFFLVLLFGVLFSLAFRKFHLPWVMALIVAGIVMGPYGFDVVETNPTIEFIGQIGLIFLMFMAGLETKLSTFKEFRSGILWISVLNAAIPFAAGYLVGFIFDFSNISSLMLGIIFMSSSIAVIVPTLESVGLLRQKLGRSIVSATIIEDIASLILLSILLQSLNPVTALPLPSFYFLLAVILVGFRYGLPKLRSLMPFKKDETDLFESEVRVVILLLIGVVVTFDLLGLHPIIAGFFTGLVLSDSITSKILVDKLRTISYGIFIPTFFVIIGMQTDITVFFRTAGDFGLIVTVVLVSMFTKFGSGWFGARISGFKNYEAITVGIATMPQLSTTLAVVFTAVELELLQPNLVTAMVILSIISTMATPVLIRIMAARKTRSA